ncbi:MAG: hypothetical protein WC538_09725 [Thermoanaerobaculia bacterium]|jgi:hypothetical protein
MSFPPHIARVLDLYGITAATKAALLDAYLQMGAHSLEAFSDLCESFAAPSAIEPADLARLREVAVARYLGGMHAKWLEGSPTPSFFAPRSAQGRANGLCAPLGSIGAEGDCGFTEMVRRNTEAIVGEGQTVPRGLLLMSRNGHYGGRDDTVSFDLVCENLDDAIAVGNAAGRQHTAPGSIGETSGTHDGIAKLALLWEVQPNAWKPQGERNRAIAKIWRRNRNWHVVTMVAAIRWLQRAGAAIYVLRGQALQATHEVNPKEPVTDALVAIHDRTVAAVIGGLGGLLREPTAREGSALAESGLMNTGLSKFVAENGSSAAVWRAEIPRGDEMGGSRALFPSTAS